MFAPTPHQHRSLRTEASGWTHMGLVRRRNEDRFLVDDALGLYLVADGLGGTSCGDLAATLAVQSVQQHFAESASFAAQAGDDQVLAMDRFMRAIRQANTAIRKVTITNPSTFGMGTTIAGVHLHGGRMYVAHVGDSRVYRLREGRLERLTEDHNVITEARRAGVDVADFSEQHRQMLTRALGAEPGVRVDLRVEEARAGDVVLICSDGLSGVVSGARIAGILASARSAANAAQELVGVANYEGGPDNVTCVVMRWRV